MSLPSPSIASCDTSSTGQSHVSSPPNKTRMKHSASIASCDAFITGQSHVSSPPNTTRMKHSASIASCDASLFSTGQIRVSSSLDSPLVLHTASIPSDNTSSPFSGQSPVSSPPGIQRVLPTSIASCDASLPSSGQSDISAPSNEHDFESILEEIPMFQPIPLITIRSCCFDITCIVQPHTSSDFTHSYEQSNSDDKGETLRYAIQQRDVSLVKQLLAEGVPLTSRDICGLTPLHLCMILYCNHSKKQLESINGLESTNCCPKEMEIVQEILAAIEQDENKTNILNDFDEHGKTPLYWAIRNGCLEITRTLLKAGPCVEKITKEKETSLHIAVLHPYILKHFLDNYNIKISVDGIGGTAIHNSASCNQAESLILLIEKFEISDLYRICRDGSTVLHVASHYGSLEIVKTIFKKEPKTTNLIQSRDKNNDTPLCVAVRNGFRAMATFFLQHGATMCHIGHEGKTVISDIVTHFENPLKFFQDIFDENIEMITNQNYGYSQDKGVNVKYNVIANRKHSSQIDVIEELIRCGQKEILIHPLIESLLYLKWKCMLPVFLTIVTIYTIFLVSFNAFLLMNFYKMDFCNTTRNCTSTANNTAYTLPYFECFDSWNWAIISLIYLFIFLLLLQELVYMCLKKLRYFFFFESWLKLALLLLAIIVPIALGVYCSEPPFWLRHMACLALLLSWIQALLLLSRFPDWGYYILIFERVSINVFKILSTAVFIIIGFAFSFMIEYHSGSPFDGPSNAFVKTLIMMLSEFDYGDLFDDDHVTQLQDTEIAFRVLFVVFVIFVAIVLMNFMIGVAVSDINELNMIGNIRRLEKQVELNSSLDLLVCSPLMDFFTELCLRCKGKVSKTITFKREIKNKKNRFKLPSNKSLDKLRKEVWIKLGGTAENFDNYSDWSEYDSTSQMTERSSCIDLDPYMNSRKPSLFKRLIRTQYHTNLYKKLDSKDKWNVDVQLTYVRSCTWTYTQALTENLGNSIVEIAKTNLQRIKDGNVNQINQQKIDTLYKTLVGTPLLPECQPTTESPEFSLKEKIIGLENSIKTMKQSNDNSIESVRNALECAIKDMKRLNRHSNEILLILKTNAKRQKNLTTKLLQTSKKPYYRKT